MGYPFDLKIVHDAYSVFLCPPEWQVNETGAVFHRVYYAYGGCAVYEDSTQRFILEAGKLYIFPVHKPYQISHDPGQPFRCLWFHVTLSPLILNPVIQYNVKKESIADHLIHAMEQAIPLRGGPIAGNLFFEQTLQSMLYLVGLEEELLILKDSRLMKATAFIQENYMNFITNECLSKVSGYNTSYFIRLFGKTFGVSPQKYVLNYRLGKAILLLMENTPVSEVCIKTGYTNVKAFCKAFKKAKGIPPSRYIRSHYRQP